MVSPVRPRCLALGILCATCLMGPARVWSDPLGPVVSFGGERFAVSSGPDCFDSAAFDASNRRFASREFVDDLCGAPLSQGPDEAPGLAFDPFTDRYWQITGSRMVRRWTLSGALQDTAFTIPLTFIVPGSGPDTLESPRGIAIDADHVYVVDAGPAPGERYSNAWFKFTRAGAPVACSKQTDFHAHLDLDPDALADDIVWSPPSSPVYPGRLLIALEHSGIQVIDTDGFYVDRFRWSSDPDYGSIKLGALAGLTIDPLHGNLYLGDNDRGKAQVWTRLPDEDPASYIVGTGGYLGYLMHPNPGCNHPLWREFAPIFGDGPTLMFGVAYRPLDERVYGYDYGDGRLWKFSPLAGAATLVDATGPTSIWGLAYDPGRDVLYGGESIANGIRIHAVDPEDGSESALPLDVPYFIDDLAFNPLDGHIYGVDPPDLVRIDRDTGQAERIAAGLPFIRGLDFDPATQMLVGVANFPDPATLYRIDPVTASFTQIAEIPRAFGWEGLACVPLPSLPSAISEGVASTARPVLSITPNPTNDRAAIEFDLPGTGGCSLDILDVTGRIVRRIHAGSLAAGPHRLEWDGQDESGRRAVAGVYAVRLRHAGGRRDAMMVRLR